MCLFLCSARRKRHKTSTEIFLGTPVDCSQAAANDCFHKYHLQKIPSHCMHYLTTSVWLWKPGFENKMEILTEQSTLFCSQMFGSPHEPSLIKCQSLCVPHLDCDSLAFAGKYASRHCVRLSFGFIPHGRPCIILWHFPSGNGILKSQISVCRFIPFFFQESRRKPISGCFRDISDRSPRNELQSMFYKRNKNEILVKLQHECHTGGQVNTVRDPLNKWPSVAVSRFESGI